MNTDYWYNKLAQSTTLRENFQRQFRSLTSDVSSKIFDLITIFGFVNRQFVCPLLGTQVRLCYTQELERLQEIQKIFLDTFTEDQTLADLAIGARDLYKSTSAFSSSSTEDCLIKDLKIYLSSIEFPIQEAKSLGCYSFVWIKKFIDDYDRNLQKTVKDVFAFRINEIRAFTGEQQLLLFRHVGIKGYGRSLSFGHLFYVWAKDHHQISYTFLENNFSVVRLLHKKPNSSINRADKISISFKEFVVKNTIESLFKNEKSMVPFIELIAKDLSELFSESEIARQNVVYYIDYLHMLLSTKEFSFEKAFTTLKRLDLSEDVRTYNFLHVLLHYFNYLHRVNPNVQLRALILESLYTFPYEERKVFDKPIQENYYQEEFTFYTRYLGILAPFTKYLGGMFLRQTILKGKETSPYLSLSGHIDLIKEIKNILGASFWPQILSSFLFLQTMKLSITGFIEEFKALRKEITAKKSVIQEELFTKWRELDQKLILEIDVINVLGWSDFAERKIIFCENIEKLSFLLQMASYPALYSFLQKDLSIEELGDENPLFSCFVNYLSTLTLEQGLMVLELFINKESKAYNTFHSNVYYNHLLKELGLNTDEKKSFLHKAIFSMSIQERQIFDQPIKEDFKISPLNIDSHLLEFAKQHEITPSGWGKIILRSFRSIVLRDSPSPYLNLNGHVKLINAIEYFLGFPLLTNICEDLLYFQTAHPSCIEIVENFFSIREEIKEKYLSSIAIPDDLFDECRGFRAQIIGEGIDNITNFKSLCESNKARVNNFLANIGVLGSILSFVTYPRYSIFFKNLLGFQGQYVHKPKFSFYPMIRDIPSLSWMARLIVNKEKKEYSLVIMLKNSLNPKSPCLFTLPFKVPDDKVERDRYLTFLFSVVDKLGTKQLVQRSDDGMQRITSDILCMQSTPESRLKAFLSISPSLQEEWTSHFKEINSDSISFFTFIEELRKNFLCAFYYTINPKERKLIENTNIETPFILSDVGICLSHNSKEFWIKKNDLISEFRPIYEEISKKKKELVQRASIQQSPVLTTSYSIYLNLNLSGVILTGNFKWRVYFDVVTKNQDQPLSSRTAVSRLICKTESIKMTLANSKVSQSLMIEYPSYNEEEEFMDSMFWHVALTLKKMSQLLDF